MHFASQIFVNYSVVTVAILVVAVVSDITYRTEQKKKYKRIMSIAECMFTPSFKYILTRCLFGLSQSSFFHLFTYFFLLLTKFFWIVVALWE